MNGWFVEKPIPVWAEQLTEPKTIVTQVGTLTGDVGDWWIIAINGHQDIVKGDRFAKCFDPMTNNIP
jgi:hypothetical protein